MDLATCDALLLCSDGLTQHVDDERIRHILQRATSAEVACRALVDAANDNGGRDNSTLIVVNV